MIGRGTATIGIMYKKRLPLLHLLVASIRGIYEEIRTTSRCPTGSTKTRRKQTRRSPSFSYHFSSRLRNSVGLRNGNDNFLPDSASACPTQLRI